MVFLHLALQQPKCTEQRSIRRRPRWDSASNFIRRIPERICRCRGKNAIITNSGGVVGGGPCPEFTGPPAWPFWCWPFAWPTRRVPVSAENWKTNKIPLWVKCSDKWHCKGSKCQTGWSWQLHAADTQASIKSTSITVASHSVHPKSPSYPTTHSTRWFPRNWHLACQFSLRVWFLWFRILIYLTI